MNQIQAVNSAGLPRVSYGRGHVLFERGEAAERIYLIHSGRVDIFVPPHNTFMVSLGAGEVVGEQAILSDGLRSARAVAATDITCTELTTEALRDLLNHQSTLVKPVVEALLLELGLRNAVRAAMSQTVGGGQEVLGGEGPA